MKSKSFAILCLQFDVPCHKNMIKVDVEFNSLLLKPTSLRNLKGLITLVEKLFNNSILFLFHKTLILGRIYYKFDKTHVLKLQFLLSCNKTKYLVQKLSSAISDYSNNDGCNTFENLFIYRFIYIFKAWEIMDSSGRV